MGCINITSTSLWLSRSSSGVRYPHLSSTTTADIGTVMLLLRTYALYDRSKLVLIVLLSVTVSALIVGGVRCIYHLLLRMLTLALPSLQYLVISGSPNKPSDPEPLEYIGCAVRLTRA